MSGTKAAALSGRPLNRQRSTIAPCRAAEALIEDDLHRELPGFDA